MDLYIANKNYSTWSMRAWVVLKAFDLPFEEHIISYPKEKNTGTFKQDILKINPNGKVPILLDDGHMISDSLAIAEYLNEKYPNKHLWPADLTQRIRARCISAEMHSSFQSLRTFCSMNIRANYTHVGAELLQAHPELKEEVTRIDQIWSERPNVDGFLCGEFSIADAFYAPVVMRFYTFGFPLSESSKRYIHIIREFPAVKAWIDDALKEQAIVPYYEEYTDLTHL